MNYKHGLCSGPNWDQAAYVRQYREKRKGLTPASPRFRSGKRIPLPSVPSGDIQDSRYANRGNVYWNMPWEEYIEIRRGAV